MNNRMKLVVMLLLITVLFTAGTAMAADQSQVIEVYFNRINVMVDGTEMNADNMLYQGTTYIPVRAAAEMLGKEVVWDSKSRTADINDLTGKVSQQTADSLLENKANDQLFRIEAYFNQINIRVNGEKMNSDNILYNGTTYVAIREAAEMLGKEVKWDDDSHTAYICEKATSDNLDTDSTVDDSVFESKYNRHYAIFLERGVDASGHYVQMLNKGQIKKVHLHDADSEDAAKRLQKSNLMYFSWRQDEIEIAGKLVPINLDGLLEVSSMASSIIELDGKTYLIDEDTLVFDCSEEDEFIQMDSSELSSGDQVYIIQSSKDSDAALRAIVMADENNYAKQIEGIEKK